MCHLESIREKSHACARGNLTALGDGENLVRMNAIKLVSAVLLLGTVGCGDSSQSPVEFCNTAAETECTRIYECYTAVQIAAAQLPATESACVTQTETNNGCTAKTTANVCTASNAIYHGEAVQACVDQVNNLTCAEFEQSMDLDTVAPKCADICVIPS
jgi:hypothetical protein